VRTPVISGYVPDTGAPTIHETFVVAETLRARFVRNAEDLGGRVILSAPATKAGAPVHVVTIEWSAPTT